MTDITLLLKAHAKYFERKLPSGCCVFASHAFALKSNVASFGLIIERNVKPRRRQSKTKYTSLQNQTHR
jgi:hypothetical protein